MLVSIALMQLVARRVACGGAETGSLDSREESPPRCLTFARRGVVRHDDNRLDLISFSARQIRDAQFAVDLNHRFDPHRAHVQSPKRRRAAGLNAAFRHAGHASPPL